MYVTYDTYCTEMPALAAVVQADQQQRGLTYSQNIVAQVIICLVLAICC